MDNKLGDMGNGVSSAPASNGNNAFVSSAQKPNLAPLV